MNNVIKQLALQAGGSHYPDVGGKTLEKFAELIVAECCDIANSKAEGIDLGSKLYLYTEDIEDTIKKHFGVEE